MKKIYINGKFITLEENEKNKVEAILIDNKIIRKVGTKEEILKYQDEETKIIDLKGKTMMPSFIDAHSHFFGVANNFMQISLEECSNIEEIKEKLKEFKQNNKIDKNKWIIANNYDQTNLEEIRNIQKEEIDEVIKENPVVIQNKSGHSGIFNTKGLEVLGINNETRLENIEKQNGKLTGLLEENAFIENIKKVPMPSKKEMIENCIKAQNEYLSYGITTVQEGMLVKELIPIYQELLEKNILKIDLVAYIDIKSKEEIKKAFKNHINKNRKNFKISGYKIFLDGSPQLRTAWMRKSYLGEENYYGYSTMQDKEVEIAIKEAVKDNMQILAHCNGDKAAEQYINAIKNVDKKEKVKNPVMIHAQFLGIDQLKEVKKYGIIPSFFIAHIYYWGDTHIKNFGMERAKNISPAKSTLKQDILFTFHQDAPVIKQDMFNTIWCAVKRKTKNGIVLNQNERIDVQDAIKAVTINAAKQYGEENLKGSIKEGKLANLIILDKNPLEIEIDKIKEIQVLETIKEGETLYKNIHNI